MDIEEQKILHAEIVVQWQRYQDIAKQVYTLHATLGELERDMKATGQKIYMLYKASGDGLNGESESPEPGTG